MGLDFVVASLLCLCGICYGVVAIRLWRGPGEAGQVPIALTAVAIGIWVIGGGLQMFVPRPAFLEVGRVAHIVGAALVPVGLLVAFRAYTGSSTSRAMVMLLLCIPSVSILLAATNGVHQLMWSMPPGDVSGPPLARPAAWGAWFLVVHAPYSYLLTGVAVQKLLMHSASVGRSHRRGLFTLALAALVPVVAVLAWDFGIGPATVPYVPIVFALMLPVFAWLILGKRVIEFSPIAYETVFQNMADPVVVIDEQGRVVSLNRGAEKLLNVRESGAFRNSLEALFADDLPDVYEALDSGKPRRLVTRTGRFLHLQVSPIEPGGSTLRKGRVLMFRDVSDVERAQAEVRSSEILLRTLFDHSVNGLVRMRWRKNTDAPAMELVCVSANAAAARFLDVEADAVVDLTANDLIALATAGMQFEDAEAVREEFHAAIHSGRVIDTEVRPRDGAAGFWLRMIGEPVGDNVAVTFVDVTTNKAKEEQMESMAATDPLTGVLNRRGFEKKASARLREGGDDSTGALLFIDLNQFKQVNDRCGHDAGDQLLKIAAERLRASLRTCDIIGRPGGDEFVALVPSVAPAVAEALAERLTEALEEPYSVGDQALYCSASIGLALYPEHAETLTGLLRAADEAMYRAKARSYGIKGGGRKNLLEKAG